MMKFKPKKISFGDHPAFSSFWDLYESSFPQHERREKEAQLALLSCEQYHLNSLWYSDRFVGFLAYWQLDSYVYIEHFAIQQNQRGLGWGSRILTDFLTCIQQPVVLEMDPIIDAISQKRWQFYQRLGFVQNSHSFFHPGYRGREYRHPLILLSWPQPMSEFDCLQFQTDLHNIVLLY